MKFYLTLIICCIITGKTVGQEAVLYGERTEHFLESDNTSRIFLDKNGDFYPDLFIDNTDLASNDNALSSYFKNNRLELAEAFKLYSSNNKVKRRASFSDLQESVLQHSIEKLNNLLDSNVELFILVHGFRKPLMPQPLATSSSEDYASVKSAILQNKPNSKIHFLEIYWDGTYIQVEKSVGSIIKLGKLFKRKAIGNSSNVGLGLRKIINKIDHPNINIIGHSLGAQVINNALWNANVESDVQTPFQKIDVCLIAPAIGRKPFRKYFNRKVDYNYSKSDNYKYSIIYNERDIVVAKSNFGKKRFVRFTRLFGNTKLGCNCSREAIKVKRRFRNQHPNSKVDLYDATSVGNNHLWRAYAQSNAFKEYLKSLKK